MVLPDKADPERGKKNIKVASEKAPREGHTTFGAGGWNIGGEKSRQQTKMSRYSELVVERCWYQ